MSDDSGDTKIGRPTKFKPEFVEQAAKLCNLGATDADLADFFDVSVRTIERWRSENEAFCRAIKTAKDIADDRVERSLYQRAIGYQTDAVKIFQYEGSEVIVPYRENVQADVTAQIFWLKNRRPEKWRDVKNVDGNHRHHHSAEPVSPLAEHLAEVLGVRAEDEAEKPVPN